MIDTKNEEIKKVCEMAKEYLTNTKLLKYEKVWLELRMKDIIKKQNKNFCDFRFYIKEEYETETSLKIRRPSHNFPNSLRRHICTKKYLVSLLKKYDVQI